MKNKRMLRVLSLVLALTCSVPMLALFATAEEAGALPEEPTKEYEVRFDGESLLDLSTGSRPASATIVPVDDDHGEALQLRIKPQAKYDYYLWQNSNNKWAIQNATLNADGLLSGTANGVTITDAVVNTEKLDSATKIDGTYYVVSGDYADSVGGAGNVATPVTLQNPAFSPETSPFVMIEFDMYVSSDFKNTSGVSGRIGSSSGNIELFEMTGGNMEAILTKHENAVVVKGSAISLYTEAWYRISFLIDLHSEERYMYVDGDLIAVHKNTKALATPFSLKESQLKFQIDRGAAPATNEGDVYFDNLAMYTSSRDAVLLYHNDFESETVGAEPANGFSTLGGITGSSVKDSYGTRAWSVPVNSDNIDKNPKISNFALSYDGVESLVYEMDYFIPEGTRGKLQSQLFRPTAYAMDTETGELSEEASTMGNGWVDLYTITIGAGAPLLAAEKGTLYGYASMDVNRWHRVSVVIDLVNCTRSVYLNGDKVFEAILKEGSDFRNLTITENSVIIGGKINKSQAEYTGEVFLDNVRLYEGYLPTVNPESKEICTLDQFKYLNAFPTAAFPTHPSLASFSSLDGNYALRLPMNAAAAEDSYALLSQNGKTVLSWDFEWDPLNPTTGKIGDTAYTVYWEHSTRMYCVDYEGARTFVVSDAVAESAVGSSNVYTNVASALKFRHPSFSYATTQQVMLEASYYIEEGSTGIIESQFERYLYGADATAANWIQLYTINTATGQFDGTTMYLDIGAWNDVKVIMNLVDGTYDMYVNGVWAKSESAAYTELTIGADVSSMWSIAKIQRQTNVFAKNGTGAVYLDNVRVTDQAVASTSTISDKFLTDDAFHSYVEGLITMVNGASVRLRTPTGLRFASVIDKQKLAHLETVFGDGVFADAGTVIAPRSYVEEAGGHTKEMLDKLTHSTNYLDVKFDGYFYTDASAAFADDGHCLVGSIVNIKTANYSREFAASAYVTLKIDGKSYDVCTTDVTYRSVANVARAALADTSAGWSAAERAILEGYIPE